MAGSIQRSVVVVVAILPLPAAAAVVAIAPVTTVVVMPAAAPGAHLAEALAAMGCPDPNAAAWNRIRFSLEKISGYRVCSGFPRVTGIQFPGHVLPEGIESVSYEVDLRAAVRFKLPDDEFPAELEKIVS